MKVWQCCILYERVLIYFLLQTGATRALTWHLQLVIILCSANPLNPRKNTGKCNHFAWEKFVIVSRTSKILCHHSFRGNAFQSGCTYRCSGFQLASPLVWHDLLEGRVLLSCQDLLYRACSGSTRECPTCRCRRDEVQLPGECVPCQLEAARRCKWRWCGLLWQPDCGCCHHRWCWCGQPRQCSRSWAYSQCIRMRVPCCVRWYRA